MKPNKRFFVSSAPCAALILSLLASSQSFFDRGKDF